MDWGLASARAERDGLVAARAAAEPDLELLDDGYEGAGWGTSEPTTDGSLTRDGDILGTPLYMSPEQARGERDAVGPRSDLYSLAVVLYELLALRHPLKGEKTLAGVLTAVVERDPVFATYLRHPHQRAVPAEYAHLLGRAMPKDPQQRFQTATEMRAALQVAMGKVVCPQCPITFTKHLTGRFNQLLDAQPRMAMLVVLGAPVALLFGGLLAAYGATALFG